MNTLRPDAPLKILYFTHYTQLYGANRSLLALIQTLKTQHLINPVVLLPEEGALSEKLTSLDIPWECAPFTTEIYFRRGFSWVKGLQRHLQNRWQFDKVLKIVKAHQPQLIHTNTSVLQVGAKIAHALQVPHIWHLREFGEEDYQARFNLGKNHFYKWLNRSAHVIAISAAIRRKYATSQLKAPISVVYNGVGAQSDLEARKRNDARKPPFTFTIIGALQPGKGQHQAIAAFANLAENKQCKLRIIGDGLVKYKTALIALAERSGVTDLVEFQDFIPQLEKVYQNTDVLLMCSKSEGMGRVTLEAMSYGLPVIGYEGGATPELIEHGVTGLLYKTTEALTKEMAQLKNSSKMRIEMGAKGKMKAINAFSNEQYAEGIWAVYRSVY